MCAYANTDFMAFVYFGPIRKFNLFLSLDLKILWSEKDLSRLFMETNSEKLTGRDFSK